ncbi:methionyl-tRNA formyltransferase [Neptuniibacter halophilus]|uniref:methionyl-tRNA formyltransferase n=1 Tax=Neptuniibacter halophilus TaxID=651666 RepID=UPI00257437A7|nr:formyltransferase family protein [Neptuniibacter halophilus]
MKIGFIGCVQSSHRALKALLSLTDDSIEVVAVVTKSRSAVNSDFVDLAPLCIENGIPYHYEDSKAKGKSLAFLSGYDPDVIFCFGWSQLLDDKMLTLAPMGAIGFHPAPLPLGRGRHPIIWAIALGLDKTASTFFKMDSGADSGPILSQAFVEIGKQDNAASLYNKIMEVSDKQIIDFTHRLAHGDAQFIPQDHNKATYWRKRSREDGLIDWRMPAVDIHNLVRALCPPYPGAEYSFNGKYHKLLKTSVGESDGIRAIEPGKVIAATKNSVLIKCGGNSSLWMHDLELSQVPAVGDVL